MISRVRGTEDILDLRLHNFVLDQMKKVVSNYNYSEIQTPILEQTKLFIRSLGTETDVVTKEMYTFQTEGGDNICLRPEITASTMRAYLNNAIEQSPWKVFSYGPAFRHERPQKGRWRQFSQFNIEIIDSASIAQDAQFIKMLDVLFHEALKLENYVIKLNYLGCKADRLTHTDKLYAYLESVKSEICATCQVRKEKNILRIFDCKNKTCQALYKKAPKLTDHLCDHCSGDWKQLRELLETLSVSVVHDPFLVRGLDYYGGTVFEFSSDELGAQSAFCGGGRYELAKELGGKREVPSIGVAIGMGRVLLLVDTITDKLALPHEPAVHVIIPMSAAQNPLALLLADTLHAAGLCVDVLLEGASMKSMMRKANKMGAAQTLIIGEEEQQNNTVMIKNMQASTSESVSQADVVSFLKKQ